MQLSKYSLERLRDDGEFILYRARAEQADPSSVLLLSPASNRPSRDTLKKLEHEYSLRNELDATWAVLPLALSELSAQTTLVLQDPGGETLNGFNSAPMEMSQFLDIAVGLATALAGLHEKKLIHKDLKPSNILVNSATGCVRLLGFGIASRLRREHQSPEPPEVIAGTLPYMAPEQTGRMNRSIDSRSDLYALGVTLYEMLTGSLPFTASEPIGWVHCHIAKHPMPPDERVENVPACVSAIVMKLLAKTPEERYQTAAGVESDLRHCLSDWYARGKITDIALGQQDAPGRLLIPEKLYGRSREVGILLSAFKRVVSSGRPELVLVSGYSGIGKSAVVNELHQSLVPPRGLFGSGKFDQYKRDIPYSTLAQAFQSLTRPLLSKSEDELSKWRSAIREALDPNGQLITGLIPELKAIIGEQPPVPDLPPQEAQRRFHLVFRRFINVFAQPEHPLALFLDDLQWLDAATLDLMENLLTQPDVKNLLLVGAYRDNETDNDHPLIRKLQAIRGGGALLNDIVLAPLTREDLAQLIAESLRCERNLAEPLADLVHSKTSGNPFFAIQFISALCDEHLVVFDSGERRWSWDLNRIYAKGYTDNVVDLMVSKLTRLDAEAQIAVKQLACLGNSAECRLLEMLYPDSTTSFEARIAPAVDAGLVLRSKDSYAFLHDRIQEAAYSLIPEDDRAATHLQFGHLLSAHTPSEEREERIFEIVNQLNRGSVLMSSREEKDELAEFNLTAGIRAQASTAYVSALHYFVVGSVLVGDEGWERQPDLTFSLERHRAECEFLTGDFAVAEARMTKLASRAVSAVQRASIACLQVDLYTTLDQTDRAVAACLSYLRHLGVEWSPHPTYDEALHEYQKIWSRLGSRTIEELLELPLMSDVDSLATLDVLTRIYPSALQDANLLSMAVCRSVNLSLERGHSDASCVAYVFFAKIAALRFNDPKAGFQFGQLGYELIQKRGLTRFQARTCLWFAQFVLPWTKHIRDSRKLFQDALDTAMKAGDFTAAVYSSDNLNTNHLAAGDPLEEAQRQAEEALKLAERSQYTRSIVTIKTQLALIRMLRGLTSEFGCFDDEQFSEAATEHHFAVNSTFRKTETECWYWIRKLQARFFSGDYVAGLEAEAMARPLIWTAAAMFETAEYEFYAALCHAAAWDSALSEQQRRQHAEALATHRERLEAWAKNCPENFDSRAALVGAEISRIEARAIDAEQLYERAIRSAHDNGFVNNEALAYERAAGFYAARGFQKFADAYLLEARYCYERWGADGKVVQMDRFYPQLKKASSTSGAQSTILTRGELLDLATVIKVSQAVSGEMVLEKLIDSLMRAALQQAGADRGLLTYPQGTQLLIQAEATTGGDEVSVDLKNFFGNANALPESLVRFVIRTKESVVIDDASSPNPFSADPYIVERRPRSIFCLPLVNRGKLISILHLENSLTPRVFTPERITVLKVLATQAAISLENTKLYRDLEDRERKIRRLIDSNIIGIVIWDLNGSLIDANDAFLRMVQYDRQDLEAGLKWFEMTPPEWQDVHARIEAEELMTTGMMQAREKEYFRKDGSRVPVLIAGACFEGQTDQGVAYILDLSKQKRAEEALRRSEAYLSEAQKLTHTGSCAIDGGNRAILYWSEEMFRLFGFDQQQGLPSWDQWLQRIHPDDRDKFRSAGDRTFLEKVHCDVEFRVVDDRGMIKHIHAIGHPVLGSSGELLQVVGTMIDVSERRRAEEADDRVRQLEANLAHLNRVSTMGELAASLAHEINQPIGAAMTNAQACLRFLGGGQPCLDEAREAAMDIVKDATRAADIIDRVRALYRKSPPRQETVDINEVIQEMAVMFQKDAGRYEVQVRTDLSKNLPAVVADHVQLQQVLMNLMMNGIEAMQEFGGELSIKSAMTEDGQLLVSVSDTGPGLPAGKDNEIFDAFFTTKSHGTGLGLAITRSIVESQNGRLWANANRGRGVTFQFTLPAKKAAHA